MTRSVPLVLLILASAFLLTTCAATQPRMVGPCRPDTNSRAPVVCIDDTDLANITADRPEAHIYRGARANFFTTSGKGTLAIVSSTVPANSIKCTPGLGHCSMDIKSDAAAGRHKYYAVVTHEDQVGVTKDPTIIIDTD